MISLLLPSSSSLSFALSLSLSRNLLKQLCQIFLSFFRPLLISYFASYYDEFGYEDQRSWTCSARFLDIWDCSFFLDERSLPMTENLATTLAFKLWFLTKHFFILALMFNKPLNIEVFIELFPVITWFQFGQQKADIIGGNGDVWCSQHNPNFACQNNLILSFWLKKFRKSINQIQAFFIPFPLNQKLYSDGAMPSNAINITTKLRLNIRNMKNIFMWKRTFVKNICIYIDGGVTYINCVVVCRNDNNNTLIPTCVTRYICLHCTDVTSLTEHDTSIIRQNWKRLQ